MTCCCDAFGSGGGGGEPGECCTLADTLLEGNTTGITSIIVSTGASIAGENNLILGAAVDVELVPIAGSAYVGTGPIVTGGANAGAPSSADIYAGQSTPGPNGSILGFRRLTAGANVTITEGVDDVTIAAAGGAAATWAATLVAGNTSGGRDAIMTTGDQIHGQTNLDLLAIGDAGNWTGTAGDATASNGGQVLLRSGSGGGGNDGGFMDILAGNGDGPGSGGRAWVRGGQGGPTNGQGGVGRFSGGQGTGAGDGGLGLLEGGPATSGQGGVGRTSGGASNGSPGPGQLHGGSSLVSGPGADAEVAGGLPATIGAGGSVRLIPRSGVGGGATGVATVGNQTILTTASSSGAGASVVRSKDAGTINGANQTFRSITSTGGTVTITSTADTINLEAAGAGFSSGSEIGIDVQGTGLVASTVRQTVVRGRQIGATQVAFNLGAGTAVVSLVYRSLTAGQVTTARARNIWGRSNLGNTFLNGLTTTVTTNLNTFTTLISITVNAGDWVISAGVDLETP